MNELRRFIADGWVLDLLEGFLKQDILEDLALWTPEQGTPQGAVISPLLSNLYLHPVDMAMAGAGFRMIRYADDFVLLCRSQAESQAGLELVRKLTAARGLSLHPEKTRLVDAQLTGVGFDFLGYHFEGGTRWPRKKSLRNFKDTIRRKTGRSKGSSLAAIVVDVNRTCRGWFEYFKHSNRWTFRPLDGWIRRRLRSLLRRQHKLKGISGAMTTFAGQIDSFGTLGSSVWKWPIAP
jgi:RNA-directed DNA polymerase